MIYDTRQYILDAAIDLFAEKGFASVSIREIAQHVGIKSASIYYHFASKDEIMTSIFLSYRLQTMKLLSYPDREAVLEWVQGKGFDEVIEALFPRFSEATAEQIRRICRIGLREQFDLEKVELFWSEKAVFEHERRWAWVLDALVAGGALPPLDTRYAAGLVARASVVYLFQFAHKQSGSGDFAPTEDEMLRKVLERIRLGTI